ncbi:hypothetical protein ACPCDX_30520 [Streptomyces koyangensis]|uniref:hypothetical protein n=1 Tax=Streptomyces koyangensis TaxID=188770 RepID=UPI003C2D14B9
MSAGAAQQDTDPRLATGDLAALQVLAQRKLDHGEPGVTLLGFGQVFTEPGTDRAR